MKKIICFGDSNTWGYDAAGGGRLKKRWPVVLKELLGEEYQVVEEGQNGRTIACADPWEWGTKAGIDYVLPMIETSMPFDDLIIMLGSNDLKKKFHLPAGDIAGSLQNMLMHLKSHLNYHLGVNPRIIVISPVCLGDKCLTGPFADFFSEDSVVQSHKLAYWYELVAKQFDVLFFDASKVAQAGDIDGLHMDEANHGKLAKALYENFYAEASHGSDSMTAGEMVPSNGVVSKASGQEASSFDAESETGSCETSADRVLSEVTLENDSCAELLRLKKIVAKLRDPNGGCPWDTKQTHESLKPEVVEEAAEVVCGINILKETGKADNLKEELGDLLLQVVMQARIAEEEGLFTFEDVAKTVSEKMIRRHPHVFGDRSLSEEEIHASWKMIKAEEKRGREWEEAYLPEAFREAEELISVAKKRKGLE